MRFQFRRFYEQLQAKGTLLTMRLILDAAPPGGHADTIPDAAPPGGHADTTPDAAPPRGHADTTPDAAPPGGRGGTPDAAPDRGGTPAPPMGGHSDSGSADGRAGASGEAVDGSNGASGEAVEQPTHRQLVDLCLQGTTQLSANCLNEVEIKHSIYLMVGGRFRFF